MCVSVCVCVCGERGENECVRWSECGGDGERGVCVNCVEENVRVE